MTRRGDEQHRPYRFHGFADWLLEDWDDACNSLGLKHFIQGGTCLGFVRDGDYTTSDGDIDVGIIPQGDPKKTFTALRTALEDRGLTYGDQTTLGSSRMYRHDISLDITWCHLNGRILTRYLGRFDTVEYKGRTYNTPAPIHGYLAEKYGGDWRTPKTYYLEKCKICTGEYKHGET